jgi:hypothetical protein
MGVNLWGESPLYENEDLKEGSIPIVTPIEQVRDEGNCESRAPAHRTGELAFGASVEAPPTQDSQVIKQWLLFTIRQKFTAMK